MMQLIFVKMQVCTDAVTGSYIDCKNATCSTGPLACDNFAGNTFVKASECQAVHHCICNFTDVFYYKLVTVATEIDYNYKRIEKQWYCYDNTYKELDAPAEINRLIVYIIIGVVVVATIIIFIWELVYTQRRIKYKLNVKYDAKKLRKD
ncbi:Hypothetical_protein [Hexamita inflata]|uniref:Hypothetical_protein n=1 Tax=Hexamita inflata TaxID=28002 RepID=A0AA86U2X8_9EUKA|nr:Hypothetical protein HINF_LOCUS26114 [Hexamita inflata]